MGPAATRAFSLALLVATLGAGRAWRSASAADETPFLLRLANEDDPGHDDALATWDGLDLGEKVARLRAGLSDDPAVAKVAAAAIGAEYLSLAEIHYQMSLLGGNVEAAVGRATYAWGLTGVAPAGIPDVVPLWEAVLQRADPPSSEVLDDLHRVTVPAHLPGLVPLLERAKGNVLWSLDWVVDLVADFDRSDTYVDAARQGVLLGFRRLKAWRVADAPARPVSVSSRDWSGEGLPTGFLELARAAFGLDPRPDAGGAPDGATAWRPPVPWLLRQARALEPAAKDVPFLTDLLWSEDAWLPVRLWAMRGLARVAPETAAAELVKVVEANGDALPLAASVLAGLGRTEAWDALATADEPSEAVRILDWAVDPIAARERWLARFRAEEPIFLLDGDRPLALDRRARSRYEAEWGVRIPDEHVAWIADRLRGAEVHPLAAAVFEARALPERVTPERAAEIADRLASMAAFGDASWFSTRGVERVLPALEVANPDALRGLLAAWAKRLSGGDLGEVRRLQATLCDASDVPALLAAASGWDAQLWALGFVHDERVVAFLDARLDDANPETAFGAFQALCVARGVAPPVVESVSSPAGGTDGAAWGDAVASLRRGDATGALLALRPDSPLVGRIRDPRVVSYLQRLRDAGDRTGYWPATAGLALEGDPDARAELLGVVREGRMAFFDSLLQSPEGAVPTLDGDPEFLAAWAERVESSCCLGWAAEEVALRARFPTIPIAAGIDGDSTTAEAKAWLDRSRGHFAYSRILHGWLPVPSDD